MSTQQDDDEDVLRDLSDKQIETLESILSILSCISAVMSFITLVTNYCNYESRKKASSVFSFFFGISSFFISATFMIGPIIGFDRLREGGPWCTFQAFFVEFSATSCTIWWFLLTFHLWYSIVKGRLDQAEHVGKYYHIAGWGYPILVALVLLIADGYTDSGFWCWVDSSDTVRIIVALYGQMFLLWIVGLYMWCTILLKARFLSRITSFRRFASVPSELSFFFKVFRHIVFICIFGLVLLALSVSRIQVELTEGDEEFRYWVLICCIAPSIGLYYSGVFLFTSENLVFWRYMFFSRCDVHLSTAKSVNSSCSDTVMYPQNYGS